MPITWPEFNGSTVVTALGTDIIVGLRGTVNFQFDANSWLLAAQNLADVDDAEECFDNISPLTTTGDMIYFAGGHNVALGIGSTDDILSIAGGVPVWVPNPGLLIQNNLDDLNNVATARINLGLGAASTVTFNIITGTTSVTSASFVSTGLDVDSSQNALTAHAGGGQGSALALTKAINRITTVATAGDSVKLPAAVAGRSVAVINAAAANAMDCFPASGEVINALSANTALSIVADTSVLFLCAVNGTWNSIVTG